MRLAQASPLDIETGIPLPVMPRADLPPVPTGSVRNLLRVADWHHPFHPRALLVGKSLGEQAIRDCRIQWVEYDDHHHKFHGAFDGPDLPQTDDERFRTVVLAAAGYVPDRAVGFVGPVPAIRRFTASQRERLWQTGQLRVGNPMSVRDFLLDYALRRDFIGINDSTIDEFLHTSSSVRRRELGTTLLAIAAYDAVSPVRLLYRSSRESHLLPVQSARTAGRFVLGAMTQQQPMKAMRVLADKLAA